MNLILAAIGSLFIAAGLLSVRHIPRHKSTGLSAIGAGFQLAYNVAAHNQFWAGVAATGLIALTTAAVSYYREDRKTGGAR
ncbi:hypothetical protein [Streptomyces lydicus]|uniref:hypothetical protein n=1 Tax=Streptomyces lydicus TaxID=47763 RepID=UPI0037AA7330